MNVKVKLFLSMLLLCAVPIFILDIYINSSISNSAINVYKSSTDVLVSSEIDKLTEYVTDNINLSKEFTMYDYVKEFTEMSNGNDVLSESFKNKDEYAEYTELYNKTIQSIEINRSYNSSIIYSFVLNNNNFVVASSDGNYVGKNITDIPDIFEKYTFENGVSPFLFINVEGRAQIVNFFTKQIFNDKNDPVGYYVQICDTSYVIKVLEDSKLYDDSTALLIDSNENVFKYPYDTLINFRSYKLYTDSIPFMEKVITSNNESGSYQQTVLAKKNAIMYGKTMYPLNLSIITYTNQGTITNSAKNEITGVNLYALMLFIISVLLILAFIFYFTIPLTNIVDVLSRKRKGDQAARFKITTSDEFGELGFALNSLLDDVMESELRYRTIVEMTDNIVFEINFRKNTVFVSNNFNQKFSFRAKNDNFEESFFKKGRVHKDDKDRLQQDIGKIMGTANFMQGEYRFKNIYGDFIWIQIKATKFFDREEVPTKIIGVMVDIDKEKKSEMHLIQRANYDALTQVYNRASFLKALEQQFEMSRNSNVLNAVLFLDLDDFKHFNDEYGHACGDEVLKFTSDCLKETAYGKGFVGRFGGDEFVVCLTNIQCMGDTGKFASEVIENLGSGFISESTDNRLSIKCSIGIAFFNENGSSSEQVLGAADEAMYSIKKHGKSNFAYASGIPEESK